MYKNSYNIIFGCSSMHTQHIIKSSHNMLSVCRLMLVTAVKIFMFTVTLRLRLRNRNRDGYTK